MLKKDLAAALDLSASMVSRLSRQGMPTDSVGAAQRWREMHLQTARRKEYRMPPMARSVPRGQAAAEAAEEAAAMAALHRAAELGAVAERLLPLGQLAAVEREVRAALSAVPDAHRDRVRFSIPPGPYPDGSMCSKCQPSTDETRAEAAAEGMVLFPMLVWEALVQHVVDDARAEQAKMGKPEPMSDEDCEYMGRFWYWVAAGEVTIQDEPAP